MSREAVAHVGLIVGLVSMTVFAILTFFEWFYSLERQRRNEFRRKRRAAMRKAVPLPWVRR